MNTIQSINSANKFQFLFCGLLMLTTLISGCETQPTKSTEIPKVNTSAPVTQEIGDIRNKKTEKKVVENKQIDQSIVILDKVAALLVSNEPTRALSTLNSIPIKNLSAEKKITFFSHKINAFNQLRLPLLALQAETEKFEYLSEGKKSNAVRKMLTDAKNLPPSVSSEYANKKTVLGGFILGARILNNSASFSDLAKWQREFANHPLILFPQENTELLQKNSLSKRNRIALAIPLSGKFKRIGRLLRDGFLAAWETDLNKENISVVIVNSVDMDETIKPNIVKTGPVDLLIGPFDKNRLFKIATQNPNIPILGLNRISKEAPPNLLQFGLSIEDEIESAVMWASKDVEDIRVLALVSDTTLGDRSLITLSSSLNEINGVLADSIRYNESNLGEQIEKGLGLKDSKARKTQLEKITGLKLSSTPRRRNDFNTLIIQSNPNLIQQIRPLLAFHYLGDIPVFITGSYRSDININVEDLSGSSIIAEPWNIRSKFKENLSLTQADTNDALSILYGLGADAYFIGKKLINGESLMWNGETGNLEERNGFIKRKLGKIFISPQGEISKETFENVLDKTSYENLILQ